MLQLFLNNWSAELTAPLAAGAYTLSISPERAEQLTGLVDNHYYHLTLVEYDEDGQEVRWEVIRVWSNNAGQLSISRAMEDTDEDQEWPTGTRIEMRFTKGAVQVIAEAIQGAESRAKDASRSFQGAPVWVIAGTSYTLTPDDAGWYLYFTAATTVTVTVETQENAEWLDGSEVGLVQAGAGQVQVSNAGITLRKPASLNARTAEQEAVATLKRWATDEWGMFGHLEPV